jgi:hypothetical protein
MGCGLGWGLWEKSLLGLLMLIMAMLAGIVYLVGGIAMCPYLFLPQPWVLSWL